jgi:NAD+ kinase
MKTFDSIFIFRKPGEDIETQNVADFVYSYAKNHGIPVTYCYPDNLHERVLIVSVGGDGTMLAAMRASTNYINSTVFGLNTGTLGFLTEEVPHNLNEYLDNILFERNVILETRMILGGSFSIDGEKSNKSFKAINEFVLTGKSINAPVITEVYINEHFVSEQLGNGVLVASSTGSTAMSLSAGGAIVSPSTNIMQIVPLVSHTLTSRPIISTGRDSITIRAELTDRVPELEIHGDGQTLFSFARNAGSEIEFTIKKHPQDVKIWRPKNWNFFSVLTEKMKW